MYLGVRSEPTLVEYIVALHSRKRLIYYTQILDCHDKFLLGTNTLAYFVSPSVMKKKTFYNIEYRKPKFDGGTNLIKLFVILYGAALFSQLDI